jgi:gamma-glutamyltranspeptidase/glutathione hydrolase
MDTLNNAETWSLRKPAVVCDDGLVVSQHYRASQVGARVLREGVNAVDAAVAASLAVGVLEPWMSGLGGGGQMLVYLADEGQTRALDFGMVAALGLDPRDYPVVEGTGADLFNWPAVLEDRNLRGYHAMAVPGYGASKRPSRACLSC